MCSQVYFKPSHRCIERELESSAKTKASTPLHNSSFAVTPSNSLQLWYNLHSYCVRQKGEKLVKEGFYFTQISIFGDSCQKGEKVLAQSKRTAPPGPHHHPFAKGFKMMNFSIDILLYLKGGENSTFKNWYLKTLLNTKRRNLLRGGFV
jgi:hypothetical protein